MGERKREATGTAKAEQRRPGQDNNNAVTVPSLQTTAPIALSAAELEHEREWSHKGREREREIASVKARVGEGRR